MLHRPLPTRSICIAYSDNLVEWYDHKILVTPRKYSWDCSKIGAGAPPIKTEYGWLEFYHGVDENQVYRLGLILFDLEDPSKIIARSREPILEPEEMYELIGDVPNVVFTCGVVEINDTYYVYYGAADKVIGVATVNKRQLLDSLLEEKNRE